MRHEFTAVYERDGDWFIAYCPEVPGANGQGRTKDEARDSLSEAIALVLGVDRFLDMCRTTLNVIGDLVAAQVISAAEPHEGEPVDSLPRAPQTA